MTVPWNCRNVPTTHVEALPLTADGKCKAIPEINDVLDICTNNQWVMWICISTIQKYYRLKPRPFWISSKYNSWIAENCNLLDLLLSILTDMAEMYLQLQYTAIGCQQYLPPSVVQLKGKHCLKPHCLYGVLDTFGHAVLWLVKIKYCHFMAKKKCKL